LDWPESNLAPIPVDEPERFKVAATSLLGPLLLPPASGASVPPEVAKTVVYPVGQFTPLLHPTDISTEHPALSTVLRVLGEEKGSQWVFTAGYFNIHPQLKELLLNSKSAKGTVVTAAPEANGFYGSKGVSGMLPLAYTLLSRRFLEDVIKFGKENSIELREWKKGVHGKDPNAWTYHAKGLHNYARKQLVRC